MNAQYKDRVNLSQFHSIVKRAYLEAKSTGDIPSVFICKFDQLIAVPAIVNRPVIGQVEVHREWRKRVARIRRRRSMREGFFDWDIDWESIYNWVLENIVPILKLLMMALPFLI